MIEEIKQANLIHKALPQDIIVQERQRKVARKRRNFDEFKQSIASFGQLQPGICRKDSEGSLVLVIGEGRLTACTELGIEFSFVLKEDIQNEGDLYEIELIENIHREDLHFTDKCEAILKLHELRQSEKGTTSPGASGGHGVRDTAEELHLSVGGTQEDIKIAMYAREIPEVADATNRTNARKIIQRIEEELVREEALDEAIEKAKKTQVETSGTTSEGTTESEVESSTEQKRLLEYNSRCLLGTMETSLEDLPHQEFDVVCFDPPWGVNFDIVSEENGATKTYSDDEEKIKDLLPTWLRLVYGRMSENSHLYLFFGIVHHELIYSALAGAGFTTNRMPIFWYKKGSHRTRAPEVWPGRCYESIAYARKGSKPLAKYGEPDICMTPAPTPKMKLNHPSAKHPDIYRNLLMRSCAPGNKVLDPMAGSGMFAVAAESLRKVLSLDWYQIEEDEDYLVTQLWNLNLGYSGVLGDKGQIEESGSSQIQRDLPEIPSDYKTITPGTDDWRAFWMANPDKQGEMLEWKKTNS